jgi:uncharacterized protein YecE (DUF72 family)
VRLLAGTSGFAYKEWKGPFYPQDLRDDAMLGYYAGRLPTVEINNTFYRMPRESVVASWADQAPDGFRFVLKASRKITHFGRLKNVESELEYFLRVSTVLGAKHGPSLFQLPPNMKKDPARLRDFVALLPRAWPAAFEFRHASWFDDETYDILRSRNAALCVADKGADEDASPLAATADWGYVRLRAETYEEADLTRWVATLRDQPWREAYVFFKHEEAGVGAKLALKLMELGLPS